MELQEEPQRRDPLPGLTAHMCTKLSKSQNIQITMTKVVIHVGYNICE